MIGFAICGSFCTHQLALDSLKALIAQGQQVLPILSYASAATDTRFGKADALISTLTELCGREPIRSIVGAEPLGPKHPLEALIIAPATGNTLAKLACGITDTPVTMAAKAHLRSSRPLLIAAASNDALSANLKNIAALLQKKQVYFVPMAQDDFQKKPHSLVADFSLIPACLEMALQQRQMQPLFLPAAHIL